MRQIKARHLVGANAVTGSVLSVDAAKTEPTIEELLAPRAEQLHGTTYKLRWPESAHAVYVTINDVEQDGQRRPFEMFINSKNMEHYAWTLGLTRMISAVFRRSSDVAFVAEELKAVFDPRGGAWMQGRYVPSLLAAIGDVVERHLNERVPRKHPRPPSNRRQSRCRNAPSAAGHRSSRPKDATNAWSAATPSAAEAR